VPIPAEPVTGPLTGLGEGPIWDAANRCVVWVDQLAGDLLSLGPAPGALARIHVGSIAACVVPRAAGGYAVATKRGFSLIDADGSVERLPGLWDDRAVRMNDGACDAQGRFFCGSLAFDQTPDRGALHRLDPDHTVHRVLEPVSLSNGIGWSPDGTVAYYVDSATQRVDAFSYDPACGTLSERRPFVEIPADVGLPDGLTVDAEGGVWVALWRGDGVVHRYDAAGRLDAVVDLPVSQPTSCVFGGDALDQLYITTSSLDLRRPEPDAGALFVAHPGVRGLPTHAFAG
jgi:sugar lactone lactonase YvrE